MEDNRELDGFCPNEVPIELSLSTEDPLYQQKLEFWMRGEVSLEKANTVKRVRVCVSNNENTRLLFSLLRAMNCNGEELRAVSLPIANDMRSLFVPSHASALSGYYRSCRDIRHPLSIRNERAAMHHLMKVISLALSKYPTTLSQDMTDLLDERAYPPFSNKRHAKIQVRGEKEVLHHYNRWARTSLEVLDVIEEELKEEQQRGVEVQLGRGVMPDESQRTCDYDHVIRKMEDDEDNVHHTIVRYCSDVLGSLRREEFKNLRKQRAVVVASSGHQQQPQPDRQSDSYV